MGGNTPPERNTAWNKGRKFFHCLGAPNNLIRPCTFGDKRNAPEVQPTVGSADSCTTAPACTMRVDLLTCETQLLNTFSVTTHHYGLTDCLAVIFKVWFLDNVAFVCSTPLKLEQKDILWKVCNIPQKLFIRRAGLTVSFSLFWSMDYKRFS